MVLTRRRQKGHREGKVTTEAEEGKDNVTVMWGMGHEPSYAGGLWKLEKVRKWNRPGASRRNAILPTPDFSKVKFMLDF